MEKGDGSCRGDERQKGKKKKPKRRASEKRWRGTNERTEQSRTGNVKKNGDGGSQLNVGKEESCEGRGRSWHRHCEHMDVREMKEMAELNQADSQTIRI